VVFHNGVVLTIENGEVASAIAVKGEHILAVGGDEEILAYAGSGTTLIDLGGRTLMPGFVDPHNAWLRLTWRHDFETGQEKLLSYGITAAGETFADQGFVQDMLAFDQRGYLRVRVSLYLVHVDNCGRIWGDWYWPNYPVSREPGAMLQVPGIKLFEDGGSCNLPALSYKYTQGGYGDLYFEVDELAPMIIQAQERGYQVAIHSVGDRAVEASLDAIEVALAGGPNTYRHRIEHNCVVRPDMLARFGEVDAVGILFASYPTCDANSMSATIPDEALDWSWPWPSLLDTSPDAHFAWHSDAPNSWIDDPDPMTHLHGFVTRREVNEDGSVCQPPDWVADDVLSVEEALPMMTIEAAYALHRDDEIGSLKAGKLADLIILSDNPLEVDPDALLDIQVLMTMVGGNVEYCESGSAALCP